MLGQPPSDQVDITTQSSIATALDSEEGDDLSRLLARIPRASSTDWQHGPLDIVLNERLDPQDTSMMEGESLAAQAGYIC